ncbi:uncharacterized protein F4822DRAFT_180612 [Hypoxylon trugodes]|uniref:uncharacterized protein n=1 Tax=Hypoxylon trugodes TaxID=326681 RepID=UPI0021A082A6|nr:uncharacterized protein F4822DRAFT_180612 [Hypoxylon trugodes]KAI1391292.1 hypothetical protein F4822DRAFT_180612 [Hypoxylon trugodes]
MATPKPDHLERTAAEPRDKSLNIVTLADVAEINDQIRLFRLELSAPLRFSPGQWLDVFVPGVSKAGGYTITSPPSKARPSSSQDGSPGYLELAVQKSDDPPAAWLWQDPSSITYAELQVRVGGSFVWPPPGINVWSLRRAVFVAGGVGINPLMSMLSTLAERGADAIAPRFEVQVLYSLKDDLSGDQRKASRMLFLDRLAPIFTSGELKGRLHLFLTGGSSEGEYEGVIACGGNDGVGESNVPFRKRRITVEDITAAVGGASERRFTVIYVCGVPTMTDEFVENLTDSRRGLGMEPHRVLCERWW